MPPSLFTKMSLSLRTQIALSLSSDCVTADALTALLNNTNPTTRVPMFRFVKNLLN